MFVGDVGRPDLAVKSADITQEDLAAMLFDSLRSKLMPLADHIIVFPGMGQVQLVVKISAQKPHLP